MYVIVAAQKPSRFIDGANSRKSLEKRKEKKMKILCRTATTSAENTTISMLRAYLALSMALCISRKVIRWQVYRVCVCVCVSYARVGNEFIKKYKEWLLFNISQGSVRIALLAQRACKWFNSFFDKMRITGSESIRYPIPNWPMWRKIGKWVINRGFSADLHIPRTKWATNTQNTFPCSRIPLQS